MGLKDTDGIANSVDPDQTAPLGAVWSGSALIAQTSVPIFRDVKFVFNSLPLTIRILESLLAMP